MEFAKKTLEAVSELVCSINPDYIAAYYQTERR
jgi:hypothetical protein